MVHCTQPFARGDPRGPPPSGQGAAIISDINGNHIRLRIQAGSGTVIQEMKVPDSGAWDKNSRHWRY